MDFSLPLFLSFLVSNAGGNRRDRGFRLPECLAIVAQAIFPLFFLSPSPLFPLSRRVTKGGGNGNLPNKVSSLFFFSPFLVTIGRDGQRSAPPFAKSYEDFLFYFLSPQMIEEIKYR